MDEASPPQVDLRGAAVDVAGLIEVLGHYLYSTPAVAVRELIQNACDGIQRRRLEDPRWKGGRIHVTNDVPRGTVSIADDGAGLTEAEIHDYLATIGAGYTKLLRSESGSEDLIGQFGLGFLSAFTLADNVTVHTASHQDRDHAWVYVSKGGERYTVIAGEPRSPGTTITIELRPENVDFGSTEVLREVLVHYCTLLPVPIRLNQDRAPINAETPPWRERRAAEHPMLTIKRVMEFVQRFEPRFEPLAVLPLKDEDSTDLKGALWINGGSSYASTDSRRLGVYVRGMLMDDNDRDLLPEWAGFVSGIIESNRLTPTAGREALQRDEKWAAARAILQRTVIDGLAAIARDEPDAWRAVLRRHNESLLGASLCDDTLFDLLADQLTLPTTAGDLTARAALKAGGGRLHVAMPGENNFAITLFQALQIPVTRGDRYAVLPFVRRYARTRNVELVEVGTAAGDAALLTPASISEEDLGWLRTHLASAKEEVIAARFEPDGLPFVLVPDREAELKRTIEADDADRRMAAGALHLARIYTSTLEERPLARLHVNLDSPLIQRMLEARDAGGPSVDRVVAALRGLKVVIGGAGSDDAVDSLPAALTAIAVALEASLQ